MSFSDVTAIDEIAVFAPSCVVPVEDTAAELELSRPQVRMMRRLHGFGQTRMDRGIDAIELVAGAARAVLSGSTDRETIRYLIYAHTVPAITPRHPYLADALRERLDLPHAEAFALTQQHCASGLSAVDVAGQLLRATADPTARALVLIGEKRLPSLARLVARTTALGEASVACLVSLGGRHNRVLSYADRTVRLLREGVWTTPDSEREFSDGYPDNLAHVVNEAVQRAGLALTDVAMIVPHNVSRLLWLRTTAVLGIPPDRVRLETLAEYGHCHCADPFLNFAALRSLDQLEAGGRYLLTAVGLGTTNAAGVVEHGPRGGTDTRHSPPGALPRRKATSVHGTTTLEHVAAFAPQRSATVEEVAACSGLSRHQAQVFRRVRGLDRLRWDPGLDLLDLVCAPARTVLASVPDPSVIRYLIFAHTVRDLTPAHVTAADELRVRLGLPHAESFAVTQQHCASGLAALDIAGELLRADGDPAGRALVVTGEKPFTRIVRVIHNATLMGEASSACLVGTDGDGIRIRSYAVLTAGEFAEGYRLTGEPLREFGRTYPGCLAEVVRQALARIGTDLSAIRLVVPHNVNMSSWRQVCAQLDLDPRRVFLDNIPEYSHCSCADPFLNLTVLRDRGLLHKGDLYLLTAVGLGATYAAMVIEC